MKFPNARLLQFARYPVLGQVKTRLTGALSDADILRLHSQLVRHTTKALLQSKLAPVDVWFAASSEIHCDDTFLKELAVDLCLRQMAGDLGEKMLHAFTATLLPQGQAEFALIVGSDCPFITSKILQEALTALASGSDVVLGPAEDGGYYLIGLRCAHAEIFREIPWGTSQVLVKTLDRIRECQLAFHLLSKLADIDIPTDIPKLTKNPEFDWLKNR